MNREHKFSFAYFLMLFLKGLFDYADDKRPVNLVFAILGFTGIILEVLLYEKNNNKTEDIPEIQEI